MPKGFHIFGVRHLSPGASHHLLEFLEEKKPKCVLIEGPSDASYLIPQITTKGIKLPIALLAYTTELPIETILYPYANYSPEYQAIKWANKRKITVRFIDLPANALLKLKQNTGAKTPKAQEFYKYHNKLYEDVAQQANEYEYDSYWERNFEHNLSAASYQQGLQLQSAEIRSMVENEEFEVVPYDFSYNMVREAHMKREIQNAIDEGFQPNEIVVVVGAYHVSGIVSDLPPLSDEELSQLPTVNTLMTLMPYSFLRLSSQMGYGAGNNAPSYYEMMWKGISNGTLEELPATYISKVAQYLRKKGFNASTSSVIEAIRLAQALTSLREGKMPVLKDLHDAVVTCLGGGDFSSVAEALTINDIGTAIGNLPEGVSQTPVQQNMMNELKRLKLVNYKTAVAQELTLDLRENMKVKTLEAAYIDLNRSVFFNRLQVLGIRFATTIPLTQDSATWAEKWSLQWSPEIEIQVVETNLKGESLEIAAAFQLNDQLVNCTSLSTAASIIRQACLCQLTAIFENAVDTLQSLLIDNADFKETVATARELSIILQFGTIRNIDVEPLKVIFKQLYLRATLLLIDAANCDDKAALKIVAAMNSMEIISEQLSELIDTELWQNELIKLAERDDLNTKLSGTAFAILLEHNLISEENCAIEVSRRLSPGVPASLGANWFEGMSSRNRYALLSRVSLWRELDAYIKSLDEDEFLRSLVFLRRAFSDFDAHQKNSIAELLGDFWGIGAEKAAEALQQELTEEETDKLDELNDFDFDF